MCSCSSVHGNTQSQQPAVPDPRKEKIRYLFETLRAVNTPSDHNKGPLKPSEFQYTVAHSVPLINLKAQRVHDMPTTDFLKLAREVKEAGSAPPEKDTIGGRMLIHGNKDITFLRVPLIAGTEGLIERHAAEMKIDPKQSEKEIFEVLYPESESSVN